MARALHANPVTAPAAGAAIAADAPLVSIMVLGGAIGFHLLGCVLLVTAQSPRAALHAFAAFIVLTIVATSHQLLPVLLRVPPTPWTYTAIPAAGFAAGFGLLIAAFLGAPLFGAAGAALAMTTALWLLFAGGRILRAASERHTAAAFGGAFLGFAAAVWLGVSMAFAFSHGRAPAQWTAGAHATLMIVAFASMLVVAISYRFVPMFSLAHADAYGKRAAQWLVFAGGIFAAASGGARWAYALALAGLIALSYQHIRTLQKRLRRRMDPSLIYGAVAWLFAIAGGAFAAIASASGETSRALVIIAVLAWLSITIFGYGLKICGFLSWQLAKQRAPNATLAPLAYAIPLREAYAALALLSAGAVTFLFAGWGIAVYLAGAVLYTYTFVRVAYPYLSTSRRSS